MIQVFRNSTTSGPGHDRPRPTAATLAISAEGGEASVAQRVEILARELQLPIAGTGKGDDYDLLLVLTPERLELRDNHDPRVGPVLADFSGLDLRPYSRNLSRRQPLARAFGKKTRTIADATAGYAQDALLLALMGFQVTAIERNKVVAALAQDGLRRLAEKTGLPLEKKLSLLTGDARALVTKLSPRPDAIYLDPMFPAKRKKSAAVKKEMRLLRALVGDDPDAVELFEICRRVALGRVVVKRPDDAPPLVPDPSMSIAGKLVRYDVYLTHH